MKTEGNLNISYLENLEQDFLDKEVHAREIIRKAPEVPFLNYSRNRSDLFDEEKFMMNVFWFFIKTFSTNKPITLKRFIDRFERTMIVSVLSKVNGNQKKAAEILGVNYTTLNEKVKRYKIQFHKRPV